MNIRTNNAGSISEKDILSQGFKVLSERTFSDMGQCDVTLTDYIKGNLKLTGGYWNWEIIDVPTDEVIFKGWWNTKEEFIQTLNQIENK